MERTKHGITLTRQINNDAHDDWQVFADHLREYGCDLGDGAVQTTSLVLDERIAPRPATEYVVHDSAASMPGSCWGTYRRVAVMEVERGYTPKMISDRPRQVVRVVETWERLNVGKTERCAFARALAEAEDLAARLNQEAHEERRQEVAASLEVA